MKVTILREAGYEEAMLGLSLSYNSHPGRMPARAEQLIGMDKGHNKFAESICVWIDCTAPRYWWSQFDTYRIGVTKQSESTMHTLMRGPLTEHDFEEHICGTWLRMLNKEIEQGNFDGAKRHLPEGFLQRRIICTNYKALRHIYQQRWDHKLAEWTYFTDQLKAQLEHPRWIIA